MELGRRLAPLRPVHKSKITRRTDALVDLCTGYDDSSVRRYRYLRLSINETFRQRAGRIVEVDDIEIYGGIADHEDKVPPQCTNQISLLTPSTRCLLDGVWRRGSRTG